MPFEYSLIRVLSEIIEGRVWYIRQPTHQGEIKMFCVVFFCLDFYTVSGRSSLQSLALATTVFFLFYLSLRTQSFIYCNNAERYRLIFWLHSLWMPPLAWLGKPTWTVQRFSRTHTQPDTPPPQKSAHCSNTVPNNCNWSACFSFFLDKHETNWGQADWSSNRLFTASWGSSI